ncbi:MAG: hypothetical protein K0S37_784 [Microbacterium sp.]|jgi:hypothetical protein|nr:hypothetical protein [Microbacterium sp.]
MRTIFIPTDGVTLSVQVHPGDREQLRAHLFAALSNRDASLKGVTHEYPHNVKITLDPEKIYGDDITVFYKAELEPEIDALVAEAQERAAAIQAIHSRPVPPIAPLVPITRKRDHGALLAAA